MCDRIENGDTDTDTGSAETTSNIVFHRFKRKLIESNYQSKCRKCKENPGFVLLQKKDVFCGDCLANYCTHKFRSTIGKSHQVNNGDRILIGFSGDQSSVVLVDLVQSGLQQDIHRKIRFEPSLLYIEESIINNDANSLEIGLTKELCEFMLRSGLPCYFTTLQSSMESEQRNHSTQYLKFESSSSSHSLSYETIKSFLIQANQTECGMNFRKCFQNLQSLSSKHDFLQKLKPLIMGRMAEELNIGKIFLASTMDKLAVGLMNNISLGRGTVIKSEINFYDQRFLAEKSILILKPLCEFSNKEVAFYLKHRQLTGLSSESDSTTTKFPIKSSIQKLTEHFLTRISEEFPSTFYTVYKTGNKISVAKDHADDDSTNNRCRFCWAILDYHPRKDVDDDQTKYSAFDALKLTSILSTNNTNNNDCDYDLTNHGDYCYSCLKISNEMNADDFRKFCFGG